MLGNLTPESPRLKGKHATCRGLWQAELPTNLARHPCHTPLSLSFFSNSGNNAPPSISSPSNSMLPTPQFSSLRPHSPFPRSFLCYSDEVKNGYWI
ncbi:unnamed protein product [Citrullus colocynthis]|uniref:Uncharacterized protein n=1 Tax=Citrullus colocynthis TaxID=252529 RepID=A0ABP0XP06_9ROSI